MGIRVAINGFGRIGRILARILIEKAGGGNLLRLRAIVVRGSGDDLEKRASLLRRDSVHGPFSGSIDIDHDNHALIANGHYIRMIYADSPAEIDYTVYGIDNAIVVDNTGKWRDREGLAQHLQSKGVAKVLLTAPGKGDLKNIVHGINHQTIGEEDRIVENGRFVRAEVRSPTLPHSPNYRFLLRNGAVREACDAIAQARSGIKG